MRRTTSEFPPTGLSKWAPRSLCESADQSVWPHGALHGRAQHQAALGRGEISACMRRAAIVPKEEIAEPPDVLVDELSSLRVIEDGIEQRPALLVRHVDDADGHEPIDID